MSTQSLVDGEVPQKSGAWVTGKEEERLISNFIKARRTIASQGHSSATQEKLVFEAFQPIIDASEDLTDGRPASRKYHPDFIPDVEHDGDM